MPARFLREILRGKVEVLLPEHALDVAKVAEESEREHLAYMSNISEVLRRDREHGA